MFGRSQIHNGVTFDMREIAHAGVSFDSGRWRNHYESSFESGTEGVTMPHDVTPTVGFVDWAIHSGYGLFST